MLLRSLTLQDFRNVALATLEFSGRRQFFLGANGQGKTNLLEAAGCLTALRSFRTSEIPALIRQGATEAGVAYGIERERAGPARVAIRFRAEGKELWWDQERIRRLADHLGQFPAVAFSSQDLQLVRGPPAGRRRWLDLTLSAMDAGYLRALQAYSRALAERNRLLKTGQSGVAELAAFEHVLAESAVELVRLRRAGAAELGSTLAAAYRRLCGEEESASLAYAADAEEASAQDWRGFWERGRAADLRMRGTLRGPHRDDVRLGVAGSAAREFASEGQQRSLVLSLRLAQAAWFHARSGVRALILADDVLGELDPDRRRRFWSALDPEAQVLASGTTAPGSEMGAWQMFLVEAGRFTLR
ncbi:MAG: DNA replication/repair protein RecF [Opitutaceae bacterium]